MYYLNNRVNYSELDAESRLSLRSLIDQFQNCSTCHSESVGLGMNYLLQKKRVWMLSAWQICIEQYPELNDEIRVGTWPTSFRGLYGTRNFTLEDKQGNCLAWANSVWVFMDLEAGRPVRPDQEEIEGYVVEEPLPYEFAPRKVKVPEEMEAQESFAVRRYHLDTNRHVNNGWYVQMAAEYLPQDFQIGQVRVSYQKSAVYGDIVVPYTAAENGDYTIVLKDPEGAVYATAEFKRKQG